MSYVKKVNGVDVPMTPEETAERQAEEAAWEESRNLAACYAARKAAYGPVEEQLDFGTKNGFDALAARNLAIKAQFPKPV